MLLVTKTHHQQDKDEIDKASVGAVSKVGVCVVWGVIGRQHLDRCKLGHKDSVCVVCGSASFNQTEEEQDMTVGRLWWAYRSTVF